MSACRRCTGAPLANGRALVAVVHQLLQLVPIRRRPHTSLEPPSINWPRWILPPAGDMSGRIAVHRQTLRQRAAGQWQDAERDGSPAAAPGTHPAAAARCAGSVVDQLAVLAPTARR
jgi:hypothetical protein